MEIKWALSEAEFIDEFESPVLDTINDLFQSTGWVDGCRHFFEGRLGAKSFSYTLGNYHVNWNEFLFYADFSKEEVGFTQAYLVITLILQSLPISLLEGDAPGRIRIFREIGEWFWKTLGGRPKSDLAAALSRGNISSEEGLSIWMWPSIASWAGWTWTRNWYASIQRLWTKSDKDLSLSHFVQVSPSKLAQMWKRLDLLLKAAGPGDQELLHPFWRRDDDLRKVFAEWKLVWLILSYALYLEQEYGGFRFYLDAPFLRGWRYTQKGALPYHFPASFDMELSHGPVAVRLDLLPEEAARRRSFSDPRPWILEYGGARWRIVSGVLYNISLGFYCGVNP